MTNPAPPALNRLRPMLVALCGLVLAAASPPIDHGAGVGTGTDAPPTASDGGTPGTAPATKPAASGSTATAPSADGPPATSVPPAVPPDPLGSIAHSDKLVWTGVVLAPDGRIFVCYPRFAGNPGPSLATIGPDGAPVPYPGGGWNSWNAADKKPDPAPAFVGVSAIRLAPDGALWVVDSGVTMYGKPAIAHTAKLVRFDLATNNVTRVMALPPEALRPKSLIDNIRFDGTHAYLTDSGAAGLIVVDLASGEARRVLDGDPATTAQRPITVDGALLKSADNKPAMLNAAALEVSPDGKFLYFQPVPGPLYRIPTALLDDPKATPQEVAAGVAFWYDTPALGGTAIGPDGTLYLEDVENDSVLALSADRDLTTILHDPRLHWPDAPFLKDGVLSIPVSQFDRIAVFHHGKSQVQFPLQLFSLRVAALPSPHTGRP